MPDCADIFPDRLLQQRMPLREAPLERRGRAQARRDRSQPAQVAGGTTEGQALFQHPDGVLQVPLGEVQEAEADVDNDRCTPSAFQGGEAERLLPVASALRKGPERTQGPRQPRPGTDPPACGGRARLPVRGLHALLQQLGRPAEVADRIVYRPQVRGCLHLQGMVAERDREIEGLLARCYGVVVVARYRECIGPLGQHPSQPGPVVEHAGQGLGLAQKGAAPPMLSQLGQRASQREAEIDGQPPGVAVLGQVREGLEGLLEVDSRLAERGAIPGPGADLLAVGHGLTPHLRTHGMVSQALDMVGQAVASERFPGPRQCAYGAPAVAPGADCDTPPRGSGRA